MFPVPANGLPGGINPVTWKGSFTVDEALSKTPVLAWQWSAANYSQFDSTPGVPGFQDGDYVALKVKPVEGNVLSQYNNAIMPARPRRSRAMWLAVPGVAVAPTLRARGAAR